MKQLIICILVSIGSILHAMEKVSDWDTLPLGLKNKITEVAFQDVDDSSNEFDWIKVDNNWVRNFGHELDRQPMAISFESEMIAAYDSTDKVLELQNMKNGEVKTCDQLKSDASQKYRIFDAAFSPDGRELAAVRGDHTIQFWDATTGHGYSRFDCKTPKVEMTRYGFLYSEPRCFIKITLGPNLFAVGTNDGTIVQVPTHSDTSSVNMLKHRNKHFNGEKYFSRLRYSPDAIQLASCDELSIKIWDSATGTELYDISQTTGRIGGPQCFSFNGDGSLLAAGGTWGISIWDLRIGEETSVSNRFSRVTDIAFRPDGKEIAAKIYYSNKVHLCDSSCQPIGKLKTNFPLFQNLLSYTKDSRSLISVGSSMHFWSKWGKCIIPYLKKEKGEARKQITVTDTLYAKTEQDLLPRKITYHKEIDPLRLYLLYKELNSSN